MAKNNAKPAVYNINKSTAAQNAPSEKEIRQSQNSEMILWPGAYNQYVHAGEPINANNIIGRDSKADKHGNSIYGRYNLEAAMKGYPQETSGIKHGESRGNINKMMHDHNIYGEANDPHNNSWNTKISDGSYPTKDLINEIDSEKNPTRLHLMRMAVNELANRRRGFLLEKRNKVSEEYRDQHHQAMDVLGVLNQKFVDKKIGMINNLNDIEKIKDPATRKAFQDATYRFYNSPGGVVEMSKDRNYGGELQPGIAPVPQKLQEKRDKTKK